MSIWRVTYRDPRSDKYPQTADVLSVSAEEAVEYLRKTTHPYISVDSVIAIHVEGDKR